MVPCIEAETRTEAKSREKEEVEGRRENEFCFYILHLSWLQDTHRVEVQGKDDTT